MRAKKKTVLKGFDYLHCDDFAKYLETMAEKGWHFKEWGAGLTFEKGEPEQSVYAVEVFTKASEEELRPEPHTKEFVEYCEAAGWKFIDAKQKFCIFKRVDNNAVALFTDEERVENSCKGMLSASAIILWVLYGINALLQWMNILSFFESKIFSTSFLFNFSVWNLLFVAQGCKLLYTFYTRRKLKKAIRQGRKVYIGTCEDGKFHFGMNDIYIILLVALLIGYLVMLDEMTLVYFNLGIAVVTIGLAFLLAKLRPDSTTNILIQIGFCFIIFLTIIVIGLSISGDKEDITLLKDELPLQVFDYRDFSDEIEDISIYYDENIFGSSGNYFIFAENSVYYNIYRTEHEWILDKLWKDDMKPSYNVEAVDCTNDWEAKQAVRNDAGTYYVRYDDAILVLHENEDVYLTADQIDIIREKLDLR
ncbi:MAG: DUF2812 domain-containing protein [Agathobacter sp.]|nr:DUF2812 domain-containing protein [Agathobacter sp.]